MSVLALAAMRVRSFVSATVVGADVLVAGGYNLSITPTDRAWLIPVP